MSRIAAFAMLSASACLQPAESVDSGPSEAVAITCPPPNPRGVSDGDYAENVVLSDCAGEAVALDDLCGHPATLMNWYGWCPSCQENALLAGDLAAEFPELRAVVVMSEDPLGDPVSAEFCTSWAETYPSAAVPWTDREGRFSAYGTTDEVLVLDKYGRITLTRQTANAEVIRAAVVAVVSD